MARSRNIKPGFFTNDELCELDPLARLLFAGIWTLADRAGRLVDRPKKIKAEVLPYDNCDADLYLSQLAERGFILRYEVDGQKLIQVLAWDRHQNPHCKEAPSAIPPPGGYVESTALAPAGHCASMVQALCETSPIPERAGLIPDSLNLIPDSLNRIPASKETTSRPRPPRKSAATSNVLNVGDLVGFGVDERHARDWLKVREKRRAPLTQTAWDLLMAECEKAGITPAQGVQVCAAASWKSLDHTWNWSKFLPITSSPAGQPQPFKSKFDGVPFEQPA